MGIEELENAVVNRSLRNVKTELDFLLDAKVITSQQYNSIVNQLPADNTQRARAQPAAAVTPVVQQEAPVAAMANVNLNGHNNEKANDYYSQTPVQPAAQNPPPPAYPSAPAAPVALAYATALYQYNAQDAGDLQLMPNDKVQVTEYMNAEWWKGRSERTGQEGIFPRSYVKVEEKGPIASSSQPTNYGNMPLEVSEGSGNGEQKEPNKGAEMGKKFGKKLGNAAIFGAGATIGSNIVNSIF